MEVLALAGEPGTGMHLKCNFSLTDPTDPADAADLENLVSFVLKFPEV